MSGRLSWSVVAVAIPLVVASVGPVVAVGAGVGGPPYPDDAVQALLRADAVEVRAREERRRAEVASPAARADREGRRSAFRGLSDGAARGVFADEFRAFASRPVANPAGVAADAAAVRYLNDFQAQVRFADDRGLQLLEGVGLPLRVRDGEGQKAPVDLSLESRDGRIVSRAPWVEVSFPARAGGAIEFERAGVAVRPQLRGEASAAVEAARAFFPNAGADTDFMVQPTPGGFESATVLRSPSSPEVERVEFDLPEGAVLDLTEAGGAVIRRGDEVLVSVSPAHAVDAQGSPIPVSYRLAGGSLEIVTAHRALDVAYPILVDPVYESWNRWSADNLMDRVGWYWVQGTNPGFRQPHNEAYGHGLYVSAAPENYGAGNTAQWRWRVAGATSWIAQASFYGVILNYQGADSRAEVHTGLMTAGGASSVIAHNATGVNYRTWDDHHAAQCCDKKYALVSLYFPFAETRRKWTDGYAGGASLLLDDPGPPAVPTLAHSTDIGSWVKDATITTTASSTDDGLGVKWLDLRGPAGLHQQAPDPCHRQRLSADNPARCPTATSHPFTYSTATTWPEGANPLTVHATDPAGHQSTPRTFQIKIDRSPPRTDGTDIAGALWDRRGKLLTGPSHSLTLTPRDAYSGIASAHVYLDKGPVDASTPWEFRMLSPCASGSDCPTAPAAQTYTFDTANHTDGRKQFKLHVRDSVGHLATREWEALADVSAPQITSTSHTGRPSGWTNSAAMSVDVAANDRGTALPGDWGSGIQRLELLDGATVIAEQSYTCDDTIAGRCAESAAHSFSYSAGATATAAQLAEGERTLKVRAADAAGRTASSDAWTVRVDRSSPSLELSGQLSDLANHQVTNGSYSLHAEATDAMSGPARIDILVDGVAIPEASPVQPCGGCPLTRDWTFATGDYAAGQHTIEIVARDQAGNAQRRALTVELDGAAPTLALTHTNPPAEEWRAAYSDVLTVSASDAGTGVSELEVKAGDAPPMTFADSCAASDRNRCASTLQHDFALDALPHGVTNVRVVARDGAGNESTPEVYTVKLDREQPVLETLELSGLGPAGELHGEARLAVTTTDPEAGVHRVTALVDGSDTAPGAGPASLACETAACTHATSEITLRSDHLPPGPHVITVRITDRTGRALMTPDPGITVDVDATPYNVVLPKIKGHAHLGETLIVDEGEWRSPEPTTSSRQWERCDGDESTCSDVAGATGSIYTVTSDDLGARLRATVTRSNSAGSTHDTSLARYVPTQPGPEVSITTQSTGIGQTWAAAQLDATVSAVDRSVESGTGVRTVALAVDGQQAEPLNGCALEGPDDSCPEDTNYSLDLSSLSEGTHELAASATASDGVTSTARRTLTLDATAPVVTLSGALPAGVGAPLAAGRYGLDISATEATAGLSLQAGVARVQVVVDGERAVTYEQSCALGGCPLARTFVYDTARYGAGTHTIEIFAWDLAGNRGSARLVVATACGPDAPAVTAASESVSIEDAGATLAANHPDVVAPSPPTQEGSDTYEPTLVDAGNQLDAAETPVRVEVPKTAAAGVVLGSGVNTVCLTPAAVGEDVTAATVVNEDSALYANTGPASDTVVRPVVSGLETWTSVRSAVAPETVSWNLAAGDAELRATTSGGAELVDPTPPTFDLHTPASSPTMSAAELAIEKEAGVIAAEAEIADPAAQAAAESAPATAGVLENATTDDIAEANAMTPAEPPAPEEEPGEEEPAQTLDEATADSREQIDEQLQSAAQAERDSARHAGETRSAALNADAEQDAKAILPPLVLAAVKPPESVDAQGDPVPTSLSVAGDSLSLHVDHRAADVAYPVAADPWFTEVRTERRTARRPIYRTETPIIGWRNEWRAAGEWWCSWAIAAWGGVRRADGLYYMTINGTTYRMPRRTWCTIQVLTRRPIYGSPRQVFVRWQDYEYFVNVEYDIERDDQPIGSVAARRQGHNGEVHILTTTSNPRKGCGGRCRGPAVLSQLRELIHDTPGYGTRPPLKPGPDGPECSDSRDEIHMVVHSITEGGEISQELQDAARKRCVRIKFLLSGHWLRKGHEMLGLRRAIEAVPGGEFRSCQRSNGGNGCIGNYATGKMHAKFALFSRVNAADLGLKDEVTWIGSANATESHNKKWNNSLTYFQHRSLYRKMKSEIWGPMWRSHTSGEGWDGGGGFDVIDPPALKVKASPWLSTTSDPVAQALGDVERDRCEIRIMMSQFRARPRIADRLLELSHGDRPMADSCKIYVIVSRRGGQTLSQATKDTLARIEPRKRWILRTANVHDKVLIATWGPPKNPKNLVITGSQNFTKHGLLWNDEVQPVVRGADVMYDAMLDHFRAMRWDSGAQCVAFKRLDKSHCPGGERATVSVGDELVDPAEVKDLHDNPELPDDDGDLDPE